MKYVDKLKELIQDKIRDLGHDKPVNFFDIELYLSEVKEYKEIFQYLETQRTTEPTGNKVLDELLAELPDAGYYLKLYKEVEPNSFEFKSQISNWQDWTDLEVEIAKIVKSYTELSPEMWGSGIYRVIPFREGFVNKPKMRPMDFKIDACKEAIN